MLKIKDNVDLKELEKFGFKPVYNKNTGEIEEYIIEEHSMYSHTYAKICKRNKIDKILIPIYELFHIRKYQKWEVHFGRYLGSWFDEWQLNLLYDLIKADLVEKVGE